jgi:hypothetical protein
MTVQERLKSRPIQHRMGIIEDDTPCGPTCPDGGEAVCYLCLDGGVDDDDGQTLRRDCACQAQMPDLSAPLLPYEECRNQE